MKRTSIFLLGVLLSTWCLAADTTYAFTVAFKLDPMPQEKPSENELTLTSAVSYVENGETKTAATATKSSKWVKSSTTQAFLQMVAIPDAEQKAGLSIRHTLSYTDTTGAAVTLTSPEQRILSVPYASHVKFVSRSIDQGSGTNFNVAGSVTIDKDLTTQTIEGSAAASTKEDDTGNAVGGTKSDVTTQSLTEVDTLTVGSAFSDDASKLTMPELHVAGNMTLSAPGNIFPMGSMSGIGTVPLGTIIVWVGNTSPNLPDVPAGQGWVLCDGTNGTPDLRGYFLMGTLPGSNNVGLNTTGGAKSVALEYKHLPAHQHLLNYVSPKKYTQGFSSTVPSDGGDDDIWYGKKTDTIYTHDTGYSDGSVAAHDNLPPYYTVRFYQWKGVAE